MNTQGKCDDAWPAVVEAAPLADPLPTALASAQHFNVDRAAPCHLIGRTMRGGQTYHEVAVERPVGRSPFLHPHSGEQRHVVLVGTGFADDLDRSYEHRPDVVRASHWWRSLRRDKDYLVRLQRYAYLCVALVG
ncbi:hypothetical protein [Kibdelosporangium philippinense]|uniref:hypothetical protein n=1 Tax=Kibdelosporangium philippinense TaxID=211113 RepID=UPI003621ABE5